MRRSQLRRHRGEVGGVALPSDLTAPAIALLDQGTGGRQMSTTAETDPLMSTRVIEADVLHPRKKTPLAASIEYLGSRIASIYLSQ
jgi:hypothetical protein